MEILPHEITSSPWCHLATYFTPFVSKITKASLRLNIATLTMPTTQHFHIFLQMISFRCLRCTILAASVYAASVVMYTLSLFRCAPLYRHNIPHQYCSMFLFIVLLDSNIWDDMISTIQLSQTHIIMIHDTVWYYNSCGTRSNPIT